MLVEAAEVDKYLVGLQKKATVHVTGKSHLSAPTGAQSSWGVGSGESLGLASQGRTHWGDCLQMKGVSIPAVQTPLRPLQTPCHPPPALPKAELNQRILFGSGQDVAVFLL